MKNFALTFGVFIVLVVAGDAFGFHFDGPKQLPRATDAEQREHNWQVAILTIITAALAIAWSILRERRKRTRLDAQRNQADTANFD